MHIYVCITTKIINPFSVKLIENTTKKKIKEGRKKITKSKYFIPLS